MVEERDEATPHDWPLTVQEAILWHHEAAVALRQATRRFALAEEALMAADLGHARPPIDEGRIDRARQRVAHELAASREALDLLELEEAKRRRWLDHVAGQAKARGWG